MSTSIKEKAALLLGTGMLATGLFTTFQPPSTHTADQQRQQQQSASEGDLSDSQEQETDRIRDRGNAALDAEYGRAVDSRELRPPEVPLKLRWIP